ncbi:hypothetical protein G7Z17_g204 [Cylindrodendrum hubeiense]|uniref:Uncharacterized protein n=1 Tax=Cylindrodendrum hubeiense TaxID=595255 RepID=A0A9P5HQJ8_9HYPO|nr:hypothetical protein G7Z17_g204 [Cylindrodendrum hubeiense]
MPIPLGQSDGHPPEERPSTGYTREEALWRIRTDMEGVHRHLVHLHAVTLSYIASLKAASAGQIPDMGVADVLDTCNKSVAVYVPFPLRLHCRAIHHAVNNYLYRRWFRPYQSEIELGRFLCKTITPPDLPDEPSPSEATISSFISLNGAICAKVKAHQRVYDGLVATDQEIPGWRSQAFSNHRSFILQPLFQALLIIVCTQSYISEDSKTIGGIPALLVRTGIEVGLSAPITFDGIAGAEDSSSQFYVKTTLETAVDLVMSLEAREAATFGLQPTPEIAFEEYKRAGRERFAKYRDDLGDDPVVGPSSKFVDGRKYTRWGGFGRQFDIMQGLIEERELRRQKP